LQWLRRQVTSLGFLYLPQIATVWPALSVPLGLSIISSASLLIYQGYEPRLKAALFWCFIPLTLATVLTSAHILSQTASALVTFASKSSEATPRHRRWNAATLHNAVAISYVVLQVAGQTALYIKQTVHLARALAGIDATSGTLLRMASSWTPGQSLSLADLLSLQPAFLAITHQITLCNRAVIAGAALVGGRHRSDMQLTVRQLMGHIYVPAIFVYASGTYLCLDLRRQLRDLRRTRRGLCSTGSTVDSRPPIRRLSSAIMVQRSDRDLQSRSPVAGFSNSDERLRLLEAICVNILITTVWFGMGGIGCQVISGYAIVALVRYGAQDERFLQAELALLCVF
jgi:hypothetical protein